MKLTEVKYTVEKIVNEYYEKCNIAFPDFLLCIVGSYSKSNDSKYSDIDLILIHKETDEKLFLDFKYYLVEEIKNCSLKIISLEKDITDIRILIYLSNFKYLFGNKYLITDARNKYHQFLVLSRFYRIHNLYLFDKDRNISEVTSKSPHFYNIKRGYFGITDADFSKVVKDWVLFNDLSKSLLFISNIVYRFCSIIFLIKNHLYKVTQHPSQSILSYKKANKRLTYFIVYTYLLVARKQLILLNKKLLAYD